jgi:uncharacterized HAD superfamily protein
MQDVWQQRVGMDLDGVIADIAGQLLGFIHRTLGVALSVDELTSEDIETCTPVSREQLVSFFRDPAFFQGVQPFPNAGRALTALRDSGCSLHIITDRFWYAGLHQHTEEWLREHRLPYDSLDFARKGEKHGFAAKLRLQWFIEDQLSNANLLAQSCRVLLLDRPYNRQQGAQARRVERVYSLDEAVERILEAAGSNTTGRPAIITV